MRKSRPNTIPWGRAHMGKRVCPYCGSLSKSPIKIRPNYVVVSCNHCGKIYKNETT